MLPQPSPGTPPPPAPADYPGARRSSFSDRRQSGRETRDARRRTVEGSRQGPVRRIRSSGPVGLADGSSVVERHRVQEAGMVTCGGSRQGIGRNLTATRRMEGENMMVRELEELRARTTQMEKTLRYYNNTVYFVLLTSSQVVE